MVLALAVVQGNSVDLGVLRYGLGVALVRLYLGKPHLHKTFYGQRVDDRYGHALVIKELIEKFIEENLPLITDSDLVANEFESFWTIEKKKAILELAKVENLDYQKLVDLVSNYLFTEKEPLRDEIIAVMNERPSLRDRATSSERVLRKVKGFVETFINGMG